MGASPSLAGVAVSTRTPRSGAFWASSFRLPAGSRRQTTGVDWLNRAHQPVRPTRRCASPVQRQECVVDDAGGQLAIAFGGGVQQGTPQELCTLTVGGGGGRRFDGGQAIRVGRAERRVVLREVAEHLLGG